MIPKILITIFLFVSIIRPFIRKLKGMTGLVWLPFIALAICAAIIPAYGFRPEISLLFVYSLVFCVISISRSKKRGRYKSIRGTLPILFVIPPLILLAVAAGLAFSFTPKRDTALSTQGVISLSDRGYNIRIYTAISDTENGTEDGATANANHRPLLVILPPVFGSLAAVDQVAMELRDRGFTVLTADRAGLSPVYRLRGIRAFFSGTRSVRANNTGRRQEETRTEDIRFLLSWISQNPRIDNTTQLFNIASAESVFFAGYGAAGSALILLEDSLLRDTSPLGINVRGLIAIESPLWSVYREEPALTPELPPEAGRFIWFRYQLSHRVSEILPRRIAGLGQIPQLSSPVLFLVSDQIRNPDNHFRYLALRETFRAASGHSVLASADGAGPLDYSDFPLRYPLVSAFFPGRLETPESPANAPANTAVIITNFATGILDTRMPGHGLQRQINPAVFQIEIRNFGVFNFDPAD